MKFKRRWFFGEDHKEDEDDWVQEYICENGVVIHVNYAFGFNSRPSWYSVGEKTFRYLEEAKKYAVSIK